MKTQTHLSSPDMAARVLLVEDDTEIAAMLTEMLTENGFQPVADRILERTWTVSCADSLST